MSLYTSSLLLPATCVAKNLKFAPLILCIQCCCFTWANICCFKVIMTGQLTLWWLVRWPMQYSAIFKYLDSDIDFKSNNESEVDCQLSILCGPCRNFSPVLFCLVFFIVYLKCLYYLPGLLLFSFRFIAMLFLFRSPGHQHVCSYCLFESVSVFICLYPFKPP